MAKFKYKFGEDDVWEDCDLNFIFNSPISSYDDVAEYLCQYHDNQCVEYPDEREIWLLMGDGQEPKKFIVIAELTRSYVAYEQ